MNLQATRILIVEDEPAHAEAVARSLESIAGLELRHMASLREFRAEGEAWHPDITLMDLNLPDGRATEVLTGYTDSRPFPIIVMTSFGSEQTAVEALKAGALDYLVKSHETFHSLPLTVERWLREWQVRLEGKRMHQELKASEAKYRSLAESSTDFIMRYDREGRHTYINQASLKMLGRTAEEVLGKTHHELGFPEDLCRFWEQKISAVFQAGEPARTEFTFPSPEGRVTHDWHLTPEFDENGSLFSVLGISRDITERKRMEQSLRMVYTGMAQSPLSVVITDTQGSIRYVNPAFTAVTGYSAEEALGRNSSILKSGLHNSEFYQDLWQTLLAGQTWVGEFQNRRMNGEIFTEKATISPVRDDTGAIAGYVAVKEDVTAQRQDARALAHSHALNAALLKTLPFPLDIVDAQGKVLFLNHKMEQAVGEMAVGKRCWELYKDNHQQCDTCPLKNSIEIGKTFHIEATGVLGGKTYEVIHTGMTFEGKEALMEVFLDITDRKLIEDTQAFLLQCGTPATGEDYFASLARYLADSLRMDYVCIDQLESDGQTAQTVAVYNQGQFESNVSYALKDTPCGEVVDKRVCCFPREVRRLFPKDAALQELKAESYFGTTLWDSQGVAIGLIAVIGQHPLDNSGPAEAIIKQVGMSAAAELERRRAKEALLETELRQRTMIAGISDVIGVIDRQGITRYQSPNVERWFGWKPDELIGRAASENIHPDDRPRIQAQYAQLLSEPNAAITAECLYLCKDGSYKPIEFYASNLCDDPIIQGVLFNLPYSFRRKNACNN